jgi:hypothetical protein
MPLRRIMFAALSSPLLPEPELVPEPTMSFVEHSPSNWAAAF